MTLAVHYMVLRGGTYEQLGGRSNGWQGIREMGVGALEVVARAVTCRRCRRKLGGGAQGIGWAMAISGSR